LHRQNDPSARAAPMPDNAHSDGDRAGIQAARLNRVVQIDGSARGLRFRANVSIDLGVRSAKG
jgi:hypothetical protein